VPQRLDGLARALGQLHGPCAFGRATRHARRFNRRYQRSAHPGQNRFYSCPQEPSHLRRASLYVDLNPARAGLLSDATANPWSSAATHTGSQDDHGLLHSWRCSDVAPQGDWKQLPQARALEPSESTSPHAATYQGRPSGNAGFVSILDAPLARNLEPKPTGRPPKAHTVSAAWRPAPPLNGDLGYGITNMSTLSRLSPVFPYRSLAVPDLPRMIISPSS
jgi:hypothetical protein